MKESRLRFSLPEPTLALRRGRALGEMMKVGRDLDAPPLAIRPTPQLGNMSIADVDGSLTSCLCQITDNMDIRRGRYYLF